MEEDLKKIFNELQELKFLMSQLISIIISDNSEEETEGKFSLDNPLIDKTLELNQFRTYIN
jgi:hypothetical protein